MPRGRLPSGCYFNGAGDRSPDVTLSPLGPSPRFVASMGPGIAPRMWRRFLRLPSARFWLQWSRGLLPGCDMRGVLRVHGARKLQLGRGLLPGCDAMAIWLDSIAELLQWGRGLLPGCDCHLLLSRSGAACKGEDREPAVNSSGQGAGNTCRFRLLASSITSGYIGVCFRSSRGGLTA